MKTKMKQLFGILLTLALVLGLIPGMSLTALAETEVDYLPTSAGAYKLKSNITVSRNRPVELGSGTISIDLAGHTITIEADGGENNRTLFHITSGVTLTIKDSSSAGTGRITRNGTSSNDSVIWVDGGTLNWEGGIVTGVYTQCGIIDVSNGQFNMSGGSFTGNTLSNNGQGAVRLLSGKSFLRISGTPVITGNTGGNVYVSDGSKIEIIGALNSGANISVNMQTPGVFTSKYGSYYNTGSSVSDPWNFFDSDDSVNKWVLWNDDFSEARLGSKQDNPERESAVTYTINYENETAIPKDGYEISTDRTTTAESPVNLMPILDAGGNPVIYIRKKGEGSQNPGEWVQISLTSRPDAPTGINPTDATNSTSADGTITGVNTAMEYSVDGTNWIAVSDTTITGLTPGTYYVRIKATETAPHGTPAKVKVGSREIILQDNQKPTPKTDLIFNGSEQELLNKPSAPLPEGADEIQYAIGTDATTPPTSGWNTSIPARTDVGTYYVWYKVVADENHTDTDPTPITVTIGPASRPQLTDDQKPKANDLTYTGEPQALVTPPKELPEGYTKVQYSIDGGTTWTDEVPTGTDAGEYTIMVRYIGDENHDDFMGETLKVTIRGGKYAILSVDGAEHVISSGIDAVITVKRSKNDENTFKLYTSSAMDEKALPEGSHTTAKGSLILTLKAAYLDTLTVGDHKVTIAFEDGSATATIKIKEAAPAPTATPKPVPRTGDGSNPALWLSLAVAGLILIAGTVILWNRKKRCGK